MQAVTSALERPLVPPRLAACTGALPAQQPAPGPRPPADGASGPSTAALVAMIAGPLLVLVIAACIAGALCCVWRRRRRRGTRHAPSPELTSSHSDADDVKLRGVSLSNAAFESGERHPARSDSVASLSAAALSFRRGDAASESVTAFTDSAGRTPSAAAATPENRSASTRTAPDSLLNRTADTAATGSSWGGVAPATLEGANAKRRILTALANMAAEEPPAVFAGRYVLLQERVVGGQAVVNFARSHDGGFSQFAIKCGPRPAISASPNYLSRAVILKILNLLLPVLGAPSWPCRCVVHEPSVGPLQRVARGHTERQACTQSTHVLSVLVSAL